MAALLALAVVLAGCSVAVSGVPVAARDSSAPVDSPPSAASSSVSAGPPASSASSATSGPATSSVSTSTAAPPVVETVTTTVLPGTGTGKGTPTTPASDTAVAAPMPAVIDAQPLLRSLTAALDAHDRKAFLVHFAGSAATAAGHWWDNLNVVGFDSGSVATYQDQGLRVRPNDSGVAEMDYVMAGAHYPLDGKDDGGTPVIGTSQYQMRVTWQHDGSLLITGWQAIRPAPWDCGCKLVATKGSHVVVISTPVAVGYARQVADAADKAVDFQRRLFAGAKANISGLNGAVVFATDRASEIQKWFRAPGDNLSDVTGIALAYVRDLTVAFGDKRPEHREVGSARLAVGPMASGLLESVLVHELVHYRFFDLPLDRQWLTDNPGIAEGVAQYVTELFFGSTPQDIADGHPRADLGTYGAVMTPDRLRQLFTGKVPTATQMRTGGADALNFWYVIAASVFVYLDSTYGTAAALKVAQCAYVGRLVFDCAADYAAGHGTTITAAKLQTGWAAWVRQSYG